MGTGWEAAQTSAALCSPFATPGNPLCSAAPREGSRAGQGRAEPRRTERGHGDTLPPIGSISSAYLRPRALLITPRRTHPTAPRASRGALVWWIEEISSGKPPRVRLVPTQVAGPLPLGVQPPPSWARGSHWPQCPQTGADGWELFFCLGSLLFFLKGTIEAAAPLPPCLGAAPDFTFFFKLHTMKHFTIGNKQLTQEEIGASRASPHPSAPAGSTAPQREGLLWAHSHAHLWGSGRSPCLETFLHAS